MELNKNSKVFFVEKTKFSENKSGKETTFLERVRELFRKRERGTEELEEAKIVLEIKVQARTRELKELAEGLDLRVKERTKELQEKLAEMERFQRLAVGRELKMVELKQKIKELEDKLKGRQ